MSRQETSWQISVYRTAILSSIYRYSHHLIRVYLRDQGEVYSTIPSVSKVARERDRPGGLCPAARLQLRAAIKDGAVSVIRLYEEI